MLGEGPAREEVARGYTFIGPSGTELEKILARAGLTRKEVAIENAFACFKPYNATPLEEAKAVDACRERVWNFLDETNASGILCLGGRALRSVAPAFVSNASSDGLMRHRGSLWSREEVNSANSRFPCGSLQLPISALPPSVMYVMATIHPAAIIRRERLERFSSMGYRAVPSLDLKRLSRALTAGRDWPKVNTTIGLPDMRQTRASRGFVFDLETTTDKYRKPELFGMQLLEGGPVYQMVWDNARDWVREAFRLPIEKGGHNIQGFDLHVLASEGIELREPFFDTMALGGLCEPDMARGLYYQQAYYLGHRLPFHKELVGANLKKRAEVQRQAGLRRAWRVHPLFRETVLEETPDDAAWMSFYNTLDVAATRLVALEQMNRAELEGWL